MHWFSLKTLLPCGMFYTNSLISKKQLCEIMQLQAHVLCPSCLVWALSRSGHLKFPPLRRITFCFQLVIISSTLVSCSILFFFSPSQTKLKLMSVYLILAQKYLSLWYFCSIILVLCSSDWIILNDLSWYSQGHSFVTPILVWSHLVNFNSDTTYFNSRNYIWFFLYGLYFFDSVRICFPLHHWA